MKPRRYQLAYLEDVRLKRHVCFAEQLRSANRAITKLYTDHLGDADIGIGQLSLLIRLYYFGDVTVTRLAKNLETDRTTVTRAVQLLERSGHVEVAQGEDLRERVVRLTDQGFASLKKAIPRWQKAQDDLQRRLGEQEWERLFQGLRTLAKLETSSSNERTVRRPAAEASMRR